MTLLYKDQPVLSFDTTSDWRAWLDTHHATTDGIWLRIYKKDSGITKVNYDQALDEALCYGWIDGIVHKYDAKSFIQKFTPRRKRSTWSEINKGHIARLMRLGKMHTSGIAEVDRAKKDGRWDAAYGSPANTTAPEDFLARINKNPKAKEFWERINKTNKYAMIWMVNNAKREETRMRRIDKFVAMLERKEKLY